jgi:Flp pilus assembly protein TadG
MKDIVSLKEWRRGLDVRSLWRCERGANAVLYAVLSVPLMMAAGLGIDGADMYAGKARLQAATDSAALAMGAQPVGSSASALQAIGQQYLAANFANSATLTGGTLTATFSNNSTVVTAVGTANFKPTFSGFLGVNAITISASAEVQRSVTGLEVALVLDNTGSMWSKPSGASVNNITAVKNAANSLLDTLFGNYSIHPNLKVSIIPYVATVNVANFYDKVVSTMTNPLNTSANSKDWKGCIVERAEPYDTTDDKPSVGGYWTQYRWAAKSDNNWTANDIKDNYGYENNGVHGPNVACPTPIIPLTNVKATLTAAANATTAWNRGGTQGNIGMAWGWRMLSPTFTTLLPTANQAVPYGQPLWQKTLVIMTDGKNEIYNLTSNATPNSPDNATISDYTAYGRVDDGRMGATKTTAAALAYSNTKMSNLCTAIKAKGIMVFTILFVANPDAATKTLWQNCASDDSKYFLATDQAALAASFSTIGNVLTNLRLSK